MNPVSLKEKEQYDLLLREYRDHGNKAVPVLAVVFAVILSLAYFISVSNRQSDIPLIVFAVAFVATIALLVYVGRAVAKGNSKIERDISEGAYDRKFDKARFVKVDSAKSKYSKLYNLQSRKKEATCVNKSLELQADRSYWFTFARHSDLIVDAQEVIENSDELEILVGALEPSMVEQFQAHRLVPLEADEVAFYERQEVGTSLLTALIFAIIPGAIIGALLAAFSESIPETILLEIVIFATLFIAVLVFSYFQQSLAKTRKLVLGNPFKKIVATSIHEIQERKRNKTTYHRISFAPIDMNKEKWTVEVSKNEMHRMSDYAGKMLLHIEVNTSKILKVTSEDGDIFYSLI